jgi:hypothetical protein
MQVILQSDQAGKKEKETLAQRRRTMQRRGRGLELSIKSRNNWNLERNKTDSESATGLDETKEKAQERQNNRLMLKPSTAETKRVAGAATADSLKKTDA